ncbi:hypothetical protein CsatB_001675 [Cannabis sativa]
MTFLFELAQYWMCRRNSNRRNLNNSTAMTFLFELAQYWMCRRNSNRRNLKSLIGGEKYLTIHEIDVVF